MRKQGKRVGFVGDRPSKLNHSQDLPFFGTPSYKVLLSWFRTLDLDDWTLFNSHTQSELDLVLNFYQSGGVIVALGKTASKTLTQNNISHLKLPHPSPRNRANNNKERLMSTLLDCKNKIYDITVHGKDLYKRQTQENP